MPLLQEAVKGLRRQRLRRLKSFVVASLTTDACMPAQSACIS